ncbi:hypothetical protein ABW19_dt0207566 [Dactylella cylindrospora]|nr:hypothetical protein ABW19_dt0207566 [Dactylella cylindrospora]
MDVFYNTIDTAPDQHVRTILRLLCESSSEIHQKAEEFYATVKEFQGVPENTTNPSSGSNKRKRDEDVVVLYCINCDTCYIEEENDEKACSYHPGEYEPDYDLFEDHDEQIHGVIDSDEMFASFPENFVMTCCEEHGDSKGCEVGKHESNYRKIKQTEPTRKAKAS